MLRTSKCTIFLLVLCCSVACDTKRHENDKVVNANVSSEARCFQIENESFIERDFNRYYHNYLESQDSCFLRAFIHFYYDSIKMKSYRSFRNCYISSIRDYKLYFNFSIVKKRYGSDDSFFYGLYDVHDLIFSDKHKLGSLIPFKNDALNDIINFLLKGEMPDKPHVRRQLLELYLINLYYTVYDDLDDAPIPIFDRSLSFTQFIEEYKNRDNSAMIDKIVTEQVRDNLFIFEINYVGAIIFKVDFDSDGTIKIDEFLAPRIDRVKSFRSDGLPDYLDTCR